LRTFVKSQVPHPPKPRAGHPASFGLHPWCKSQRDAGEFSPGWVGDVCRTQSWDAKNKKSFLLSVLSTVTGDSSLHSRLASRVPHPRFVRVGSARAEGERPSLWKSRRDAGECSPGWFGDVCRTQSWDAKQKSFLLVVMPTERAFFFLTRVFASAARGADGLTLRPFSTRVHALRKVRFQRYQLHVISSMSGGMASGARLIGKRL
jgi:hypothetical protein